MPVVVVQPSFQESFDGLGGASVFPVGVGGGEDCSLQCGVAVAVQER